MNLAVTFGNDGMLLETADRACYGREDVDFNALFGMDEIASVLDGGRRSFLN